jgi:hypothetical protein
VKPLITIAVLFEVCNGVRRSAGNTDSASEAGPFEVWSSNRPVDADTFPALSAIPALSAFPIGMSDRSVYCDLWYQLNSIFPIFTSLPVTISLAITGKNRPIIGSRKSTKLIVLPEKALRGIGFSDFAKITKAKLLFLPRRFTVSFAQSWVFGIAPLECFVVT